MLKNLQNTQLTWVDVKPKLWIQYDHIFQIIVTDGCNNIIKKHSFWIRHFWLSLIHISLSDHTARDMDESNLEQEPIPCECWMNSLYCMNSRVMMKQSLEMNIAVNLRNHGIQFKLLACPFDKWNMSHLQQCVVRIRSMNTYVNFLVF